MIPVQDLKIREDHVLVLTNTFKIKIFLFDLKNFFFVLQSFNLLLMINLKAFRTFIKSQWHI